MINLKWYNFEQLYKVKVTGKSTFLQKDVKNTLKGSFCKEKYGSGAVLKYQLESHNSPSTGA